jgi:hypothetical protein
LCGEADAMYTEIGRPSALSNVIAMSFVPLAMEADADYLSIDSSTVSAKKGRGRRLATTTVTTRRRKETKYMQW